MTTHPHVQHSLAILFLAATLSGAYDDLRHQLMARYPDWLQASRSPEFARSLNRVWPVIGEWSASYLRAHPDATAKELAAAVEQLNGAKCAEKDEACLRYQLAADAVALGHGTYVVLASFPQSATFFVVSKSGVLWNIKDVAARHLAKRDELGAWAWLRFSYGDGPMIGRIAPLPPTRSGHARFYVDGEGAAPAGATYRKQISVWEWDGVVAIPEIIQSYRVSLATDGGVQLKDGELRIMTKGDHETFWILQITPEGVRDRGSRHAVPDP